MENKFSLSGHGYTAVKDGNIDFEKAKVDRKEQQKIINSYLPMIKKNSVINCRIDEDLLQEQLLFVIEEVIQSYDKDKGAFSTYLTKLLSNNRINYIKHNDIRNHVKLMDRVGGHKDSRTLSELLLVDYSTPENSFFDDYLFNSLLEIIEDLDYLHRKVIKLYYGFDDDMTYKEIGEELGYSSEYMRQKCEEAKKIIRRRLKWEMKV